MRLKRLEVRGFKSFADRTEFDFTSSLTGIVGPNGCGKSNVVDALKWVLGDQRAKSLRGAEMTDVIFKGAEGREGTSVAEVTVHLEDTTGLLGDRTEVRIGRRLTKDKESHYLIDGQPVRLKDVRDLLLDTGLGVGAYSVMEQGRIDSVLSANPESRRSIFEEAAGISKFKLQKRESLRKLERTEQNLARVQDLLDERARRIRSLRIQAGRARRYRDLRSQLRDIKAAIAVIDGRGYLAAREELRTTIAELEGRLERAESEYAESTARIEAQDAEIREAESAAEIEQERLREAKSRIEQLTSGRDASKRRAEELQIDADGCAERVAELEGQRARRREELATGRAELEALESSVIELHKRLETLQEDSKAARRAVTELEEGRERSREQVLEWLHAKTRNRNAVHDQEVQKRNATAALDRLESRLADLDVDRAGHRSELHDRRAELEELLVRLADVTQREQSGLDELDGADRDVASLARRESTVREEFASVRSRLDVLDGMEQHFEGLDQGPKYLLENEPEGLRGRLLDLLEVSLEDSKALEAALGPYVHALVVDTRTHADEMLATLAREGAGRAM
ncbi:MAG: AAA family ATPase, partial [Planctomycetes bacterium]|nr:AAA family ATPase [Planctomycetota bacterium]